MRREPTTTALAVFATGGTILLLAFPPLVAAALWYHGFQNAITTIALVAFVIGLLLLNLGLLLPRKKTEET